MKRLDNNLKLSDEEKFVLDVFWRLHFSQLSTDYRLGRAKRDKRYYELALNIVFDLIKSQKIILGGSSGINIMGAIKLAKKMGPGKNIVTILCDHGKRYASKIFNKKFLQSKNLPIPDWL